MSNIDLSNHAFLEKEAFFGRFLGRGASNGTNLGKFVMNAEKEVGKANGPVRMYDGDKIKKIQREEMDRESNGLVLDAGIGAMKFLPKGEKIQQKAKDGMAYLKDKTIAADTWAGKHLAGKNPEKARGKFFSTPVGEQGRGIAVGEKTNADGSVSQLFEGSGGQDRRPSLMGPVTNTTKVVSPFLATAYVGEKMYGNENKEEQQPQTMKVAENNSDGMEVRGILKEEIMSLELDKQASMNKIAQLEENLEKSAAEIDSLTSENHLLQKEAAYEREEKMGVRKELSKVQRELDKTASDFSFYKQQMFDEKREKVAFDMVGKMLELQMIKQSEYNERFGELKTASEDQLKLYDMLIKQAQNQEEGLASLGVLVDYNSNGVDSYVGTAENGLSKRGQTIGEAAKELNKH
jgi:hypothetical protein